jgi:hypothetical protein
MFYFADPGVFGEIDQNTNTIAVSVPAGTVLTSLTPVIYFRGKSLSPPSGQAADFSAPRVYSVKPQNGPARDYRVNVTPRLSGEKKITNLSFGGVPVTEMVIGAAANPDGHIPIAVTVPASTQLTQLEVLRPVITWDGASITPPGGTAQNDKPFNDEPRNFSANTTHLYTVTAADGSSNTYAVTVHRKASSAAVITSFTFNAVPITGGTVLAVGQIDQAASDIKVKVPYDVDLTTALLAPTITWIGGSITPPAGSASTDHPFTDTGRYFSSNIPYKVKAEDGTEKTYTVTVTKNPKAAISYVHVEDGDFLEGSLNQGAGTVTLSIKDEALTDYTPPGPFNLTPIEWYVDGNQVNVPPDTKKLTLSTSGPQALPPGEHRVVAMAVKNEDGKHYTNSAVFTVGE